MPMPFHWCFKSLNHHKITYIPIFILNDVPIVIIELTNKKRSKHVNYFYYQEKIVSLVVKSLQYDCKYILWT